MSAVDASLPALSGEARAPRRLGGLRLESDAMLHFDMLRFVAAAAIVWHHSHEFFLPMADRAQASARSQALALFEDLVLPIQAA